jgi:hypothetical protein
LYKISGQGSFLIILYLIKSKKTTAPDDKRLPISKLGAGSLKRGGMASSDDLGGGVV